jgi:hypothetical protein
MLFSSVKSVQLPFLLPKHTPYERGKICKLVRKVFLYVKMCQLFGVEFFLTQTLSRCELTSSHLVISLPQDLVTTYMYPDINAMTRL